MTSLKKIGIAAAALYLSVNIAYAQPTAQAQYNEYKKLQRATERAFAVPAPSGSTNGYKPATQTATASSSSSQRSSTGAIYTPSAKTNVYADDRVMKRNAAIDTKNAARLAAYEEKENKLEKLINDSGLERTGENYNTFIEFALAAGFDYYGASRILGGSPEGYDANRRREKGITTAFYQGSTKSICEGDCTETLTLADGAGTYVGNTKQGLPHGKGLLSLKNGDKHEGNFDMGVLSGNVKITMANGDFYEGGYKHNMLNGQGKLVYADGEGDEGVFKDNKIYSGTVTQKRKLFTHTGSWTAGKETGVHTYKFADGRVKTVDFDDKSIYRKIYTNGTEYEGEPISTTAPYRGKMTFENKATFEGIFDKEGNFSKGYYVDTKGNTFEGEYRNLRRYRGKSVRNGDIFEGEFQPNGNDIKAGKYTKPNKVEYGMWNAGSLREGYSRIEEGGRVMERIYKEDKEIGPLVYYRTDGTVFTGIIGAVDGYQFTGLLKGTDGKSTPYSLSNEGSWEEMEGEAALKAAAYAKVAETAIVKGRALYIEAVKFNPAVAL
ncbi:hypothetical protein DJ568_14075 [Mucilaginibacter hurinus]|uniref:Uncharacterized protein n=1 Tax=Mucilaginibacter hurinus TaxID=2201324 RepID=A0A367GMV1_9SPHI|nr:hypothetical protein [Mucilaginibacter hurinus]RCH54011.1 hypothetical protein DJ568_14075 [Mucilaginibacter hurinus]